jgi:hypothetical protein
MADSSVNFYANQLKLGISKENLIKKKLRRKVFFLNFKMAD